MAKEPHPLSRLSFGAADFHELSERSFETEVVNFLFSRTGLSHLRADLARKNKAVRNDSRVTLLDFCLSFPSFPLALSACVIKKLPEELRFSRLFSKFENSRLFKLRRERMETRPEELQAKPFGLIARWPHVPYGIVLHNLHGLEGSGGMFTFRGVADGLPYALALQPLSSLVETVLKQRFS